MLKVQRILVPMDDSELSEKALDAAITMAERFDATVYPMFARRQAETGRDDLDADEVEKDLASLVGSVQQRLKEKGHTLPMDRVKAEVRTGSPEDTIGDAVREHKIDLLIMATQGRHSMGDWLRGSTTERVLHRTDVTVMILRNEHLF